MIYLKDKKELKLRLKKNDINLVSMTKVDYIVNGKTEKTIKIVLEYLFFKYTVLIENEKAKDKTLDDIEKYILDNVLEVEEE